MHTQKLSTPSKRLMYVSAICMAVATSCAVYAAYLHVSKPRVIWIAVDQDGRIRQIEPLDEAHAEAEK